MGFQASRERAVAWLDRMSVSVRFCCGKNNFFCLIHLFTICSFTTTKVVKNNDLGCVWLGAGVALRVELLERLWCSVVWFGLIIWRQYC